MTHRFLAIFLLALLLTGCSGESSTTTYNIGTSGSWQDGTYCAQAQGYAGGFAVEVTIESGRLSTIDASKNNETPERGGAAIDTMIPEMLRAQTYDVDGVSGATITAQALRDAVGRCLEEASSKK